MRHIILSDNGYNVAPDAHHRLLVVENFPDSPRDQELGLFIAKTEQAEFLRVGEENYTPSEIVVAVANKLQKRATQQFLTGFVALSFV